ncbi:hypothetical protein DUNSADRAFT_8987, partial [Dunaliella salina]
MDCLPLLIVFISVLATTSAQEAWSAQIFGCAKSCESVSCDNQGIRYGKYCGIFHTGCDGMCANESMRKAKQACALFATQHSSLRKHKTSSWSCSVEEKHACIAAGE